MSLCSSLFVVLDTDLPLGQDRIRGDYKVLEIFVVILLFSPLM